MTEIWKASFILPSASIEQAEAFLWEAFDNLCLYRHEDDPNKHSVEITYQGDKNAQALTDKVKTICQQIDLSPPNITFEEVPDINWLEHVYESYPPVDAGRFFVHGSHISDLPNDKITISLNAATAFGTGEHGTTKGCLLALDDLLKENKFERPLDMGCGAGLLAIAMAKALEKEIIAIDNDGEAVRVTQENAKINQVDPFIVATCGDGFHTPLVEQKAPYDLIMANILAGPLVDMAADMKKYSASKAVIILSGLLQTQEEMIVNTYEALGFSVLKKYPIDEWQTLVMKR